MGLLTRRSALGMRIAFVLFAMTNLAHADEWVPTHLDGAGSSPGGDEPTDLPRMPVFGVSWTDLDISTVLIRLGVRDIKPRFSKGRENGEYSGDGSDSESSDDKESKPTCEKDAVKGNPIDIATGNKLEPELDFAAEGEMPLYLQRTYNHHWNGVGLLGWKWLSNFDYRLSFGSSYHFGDGSGAPVCYARPSVAECSDTSMFTTIWVHRPDGSKLRFLKAADGVFYEDEPSPIAKIVRQGNGTWVLYGKDNERETYSVGGYPISRVNEAGIGWTFQHGGMAGTQLQRVTHTSGRSLEFTWVGDELRGITDPAGRLYSLSYTAQKAYDGLHILQTVTPPSPASATITYHYNDNPVGAIYGTSSLTGKSFNGTRYSWFTYYGSRATSTEHAGGVERYQFTYTDGADGLLTVDEVSPLGKQAQYVFKDGKAQSVTGLPSNHCAGAYRETTYDANGNRNIVSDFNGNLTDFDYAANGRLTTVVAASGEPEARTTRYTWDEAKNRVTAVTVDGVSRTNYTYTTGGRVSRLDVTNLSANGVQGQVRSTLFAYTTHPNGLLATASIDGPLPSDTVTYSYNAAGDLTQIANTLGVIRYSDYNALGQAGKVVGINGAVTEYDYDDRGRVTAVRPIVNGAAQATNYTYDTFGRLQAVQSPDGRTLTREFDDAWRVTREYQTEPGGTWAVRRYSHNNASQVTSVTVQRTTAVVKPASIPALSLSSAAPGDYTLTWTASNGTEYYVLEERASSGSWTQSYTGASRTKSFSSKPAGTYSYRAKACNAEGCTGYSSEQSLTVAYPPSTAPVVSAPSADNNGAFTVTWSSSALADEYRLQQRLDGGTWTSAYIGGALSKALSGLANGTYDFRVTACNEIGCSSYSAIETTVVTHPPAMPTLTVPAADNNGAFTATWSSVSTATRYDLVQRKDGGSWVVAYSGNLLSKAFSGLTNGTYDHQARACNAGGCSAYTAVETLVVTHPPATPSSLATPATSNTGSFTATWNAAATATRYELVQRKDGGGWTTVYNGASLSRAFSGLGNGTYDHQVRACNVGGCSSYTPVETTVVTLPPATPSLTVPVASNNGAFIATWGGVSTSTRYDLVQRKDGGSWVVAYSGTSLSKAFSGLTNGTYDHQARACNVGGCSPYTPSRTTVVTFPPSSAPTLTAPYSVDTYEDYTLSWTAVSNATTYQLQSSFNGGAWTTVHNGSARTLARNHAHESTHRFQVRACNAGGCGPFSAIKTVYVVDVGGGGPCYEGVCGEPK